LRSSGSAAASSARQSAQVFAGFAVRGLHPPVGDPQAGGGQRVDRRAEAVFRIERIEARQQRQRLAGEDQVAPVRRRRQRVLVGWRDFDQRGPAFGAGEPRAPVLRRGVNGFLRTLGLETGAAVQQPRPAITR